MTVGGRRGVAAAFLACVAVVAGCDGHIISPYDVALDKGVQDFKSKLMSTVLDAGAKAGTPDGTFDAFKKSYADLELDLVTLRDRAVILEANDADCSVSDAAKKVLAKLSGDNAAATAKVNAALAAAPAAPQAPASGAAPSAVPVSPVAIGKQKGLAPAVGCMTRLIDNIAGQLTDIESLHSNPAACQLGADKPATCLRPDLAAGALGAANISLDAAQVVEVYKNQGSN